MGNQETTTLAVCGTGASDLDSLVGAVRQSGAWGVIPIQWPDEAAIVDARRTARAYLFHSGLKFERPADDLIALLGQRPPHMPLLVVGNEPTRRAQPTLWLPELPAPPLLGQLITHLLDGAPVADTQVGPSWRRKSDMIIGDSAPIRQLLHSLDQLAPATTPVLITGESGTGKELVARALHYSSPRAKEPFIALNCAAIPENLIEAELFGHEKGAFTGAVNERAGAFEAADGGTLFLDEIGEMPLGAQAKLLRVLETSEVQRLGSTQTTPVNFRLVSATNRMLDQEVKAGRFREDLFYRIHVYPVHIAPLRERAEDIPRLVTHHLAAIAARENRPVPQRLTPEALEKLLGYGWPGNVRELVNLLERAALMADGRVIEVEHIIFPQSSPSGRVANGSLVPYREAKVKFETDYYSQLMRTAGGNVSLAAKLAQKTRKEIYDALKRCGISQKK